MFTGVFRDRNAKRSVAARSARDLLAAAEQALSELLASRELRGHSLSRHCEIGPFLVEYLFPERSLIIELTPELPGDRNYDARLKFFKDMGYAVLGVSPREVLRHPARVQARVLSALAGQ